MIEKIEHELSLLPENFVVLVMVDPDGFEELNMHLLDLMANREKLPGCYITVNRGYNTLIELLKRNNIDFKNLFFIDCISEEVERVENAENCIYIDSPEDLTELAETLDDYFAKKKDGFIFLDSVSTLAIYNDAKTILKFIHFLSEKTRIHNVKCLMIMVNDKSDNKLADELAQFCDKIIAL